MTVSTTTLGERGILRLPAAVRAQAGVDKGDEMVVIAAGPGRIVLSTRAAIQDEVWAAAPPPASPPVSLREVRDADNATVAAKRRRAKRAQVEASDDEQVGAALLAQLGI